MLSHIENITQWNEDEEKPAKRVEKTKTKWTNKQFNFKLARKWGPVLLSYDKQQPWNKYIIISRKTQYFWSVCSIFYFFFYFLPVFASQTVWPFRWQRIFHRTEHKCKKKNRNNTILYTRNKNPREGKHIQQTKKD